MKIFLQDVGEARLLGIEADQVRSHKLRVEHEGRLDFPGKKLSFTFNRNGPVNVNIDHAYSLSFSCSKIKSTLAEYLQLPISYHKAKIVPDLIMSTGYSIFLILFN